MAIAVVDALEMVDIEHHQRRRQAGPARQRHPRRQRLVKAAPVRHARGRVEHLQARQFAAQFFTRQQQVAEGVRQHHQVQGAKTGQLQQLGVKSGDGGSEHAARGDQQRQDAHADDEEAAQHARLAPFEAQRGHAGEEKAGHDQRAAGTAQQRRHVKQVAGGKQRHRQAQHRQYIAAPAAAPGRLPQRARVQRHAGKQQAVAQQDGQHIGQDAAEIQQTPGHGLALLGYRPGGQAERLLALVLEEEQGRAQAQVAERQGQYQSLDIHGLRYRCAGAARQVRFRVRHSCCRRRPCWPTPARNTAFPLQWAPHARTR